VAIGERREAIAHNILSTNATNSINVINPINSLNLTNSIPYTHPLTVMRYASHAPHHPSPITYHILKTMEVS